MQNLQATCYPLCSGERGGSKNLTFVCIQSASIFSAHAEDPRELFRIRPVGDVEKFNTSALQETSTTLHSKNT